MSQLSPENKLSDSFELSRKFQELKESLEKDYIDIKIPNSTSPIFGSILINPQKTQETQLIRTETDRNSLRDYLLLSKDKIQNTSPEPNLKSPLSQNRETLKSRNEEFCDLEKSRLEMRLTTLLEKEKEIFNKTKDMQDIRKFDKRDMRRNVKTEEETYLRGKRFESINFEENKDKEKELLEMISKLNERCEENDILINNLAKEKVEIYEQFLDERNKNSQLSDKLEKSMKELHMQLSQSHYEKKESEEEFLQNLKSLKEELEAEKTRSRRMEKELSENEKKASVKKEQIENDIKNLKEELGFIKNLNDVVSQTNNYQNKDKNHNSHYSVDFNNNNLKEKFQKLKKKYKKLKEKTIEERKEISAFKNENEMLFKKIKELEALQTEQEDINNINELRENIHQLNTKLNELSHENFDLNEKNDFLQFQIKNFREKQNCQQHNQLLEDKLIFIEQKNEKIIIENNKLNNKISVLSGQYLDLIKNFKKKIDDFRNFAIQESDAFKLYKENIASDLNIYIEKEKRIYLNKIKTLKEEINNKDNYIRILEKSKRVLKN